jgi:hypothetical protein
MTSLVYLSVFKKAPALCRKLVAYTLFFVSSKTKESYITHSLIPEKTPIVQLLKNFRAFYVIGKFIGVFSRARHWYVT